MNSSLGAIQRVYRELAPRYDRELLLLEWLYTSQLRKALLRKAKGRVLELGAGTLLNASHYPRGVDLVALDGSEAMLAQAKKRVGKGGAGGGSRGVLFIHGDAEALPFPEASFDTAVETFVLCTADRPQRVLREMVRVVRPGGRVLLMDHGISKNRAVAILQRALAPWQFRRLHCRLTLDLPGLYRSTKEVHFALLPRLAQIFVLAYGKKLRA